MVSVVVYGWRSIFFFFFKQKTAYEMRISDWSSDVCSSDLVDAAAAAGDGQAHALLVARRQGDLAALLGHRLGSVLHQVQDRLDQQIGRASCRERVCQYV